MPYQPYRTIPRDYNLKSGSLSGVSIYPLYLRPQTTNRLQPLAEFDFNNYTAGDSFIIDSEGGNNATIGEYTSNSFNTANPGNYFLQIYAPNQDPALLTGCVNLPTFSNITAIEVWLLYDFPGTYYSQYVLDARVGAADGYWITGSGTSFDLIGTSWNGGTLYNNTVSTAINSTAGTPVIEDVISGLGWRQLVFIPPSESIMKESPAV